MTDAELVRRVLAGEVEAYAVLVARYRDRFGRFAARMLGSEEDAEEALQDAFVRAYESLARCDDPARFAPWFFQILVNRCRTRGAQLGARARRFVRDDDALAAAPAPHAAERMERDETLAWALARLDARSREAFLLKHAEELDYETMARLTGDGVSALKMRVKRACAQLRALLREVERV
jgi:RNA polymerase sigma-70 factor (ECF subfamily)